MTVVFAVVGEHREDPDRLLLLGDDGLHYDLRLPDGPAVPVEPDDHWTVDPPTVDPLASEPYLGESALG